MAPVLGYWDTRGRAQMIRNLLVYKNVSFEDKRLPYGPAPDYASPEWQAEKFSLGLKFPNLPYYIDGDLKLTQSVAILRYLGRKYDLAGRTEAEVTQLDFLEQQAHDLLTKLAMTAFAPDVDEARKKYEADLDNELRPWAEFFSERAWALSERLTYVDFILYEALDWIRDFKPDFFRRFPSLVEYLNQFEQLPNLKKYMTSDKYRKFPMLRRQWTWGVKKTSCQF